MKLTKVPNWIRKLKSDRVWDFSDSQHTLYLTFDDGPQPKVTEWVLDLLKSNKIKATFFCVGNNVQKYPEIYQRILDEGHQVGNHTQTHRNARKTSKNEYLEDVQLAQNLVKSNLFRPPYGRITNNLVQEINKKGMQVIMWSKLSYDFQQDLNTELQLQKLNSGLSSGDILVFHDSVKAFDNLKKMLPSFIEQAKEQGFTFDRIDLE